MNTILIFVAVLFFPSSAFAQAPTPPSQAVHAGYSSLVFDDEFGSINLSNSGNDNNWYTNWPRSLSAPVPTYPWGPGPNEALYGTYTLVPWSGLEIVLNSNAGGGVAIYGHCPGSVVCGPYLLFGYFEARMKWSAPDGTTPGMVFWLEAKPYFEGTDFDEGLGIGNEAWCELDIYEPYGTNHYAINTTMHSWYRTSGGVVTNTKNSNSGHATKTDPLDGDWHTFGLLWQKGLIIWYLDNVPVQTLTSYPICDTQPMTIIAGVQGQVPQTVHVDWIRVWQGPNTDLGH